MADILNSETLAGLRELDEPGQTGFLSEIITAYLSDSLKRFQVIRDAHSAGDADIVAKTAHAIKGSSLNVGADNLAGLMHAIEKAGKAGSVCPVGQLDEAESQFLQAREALQVLLQ